jgi:formate C-acetyltransferase
MLSNYIIQGLKIIPKTSSGIIFTASSRLFQGLITHRNQSTRVYSASGQLRKDKIWRDTADYEEFSNFEDFNYKNVKDFTRDNYTPYFGDSSFLKGPTKRTLQLLNKVTELMKKEHNNGVLDIDTITPSTITSHNAGYIDKNLEIIVGLQTDSPLKLAMKPLGGVKIVKEACKAYGYEMNNKTEEIFTKYRKTQNEAIFDVYTPEIKLMRSNKLLTGLPDSYARGRYQQELARVPLFGIDKLINEKLIDFNSTNNKEMTYEIIREREEIKEQIKALQNLKIMAQSYDIDITKPVYTAKEVIQNLYITYLGTIKESDGAAMCIGRIDTFLDIFIENDIKKNILTEETAQELIDDFVLKIRLVRHLRGKEYNELFAASPVWGTITLGGLTNKEENLVTKTSYRFLNTLINLKSHPEPNLSILYSYKSPENWKKYCIEISIKTSSIQYESDDLIRPLFGDNAGISCCVSLQDIGKQKQFFGARMNLLKVLLYSLNNGVDEITGVQVAPKNLYNIKKNLDGSLNYDEVMNSFIKYLSWTTHNYAQAMNIIHCQHDKYNYEALLNALHDTKTEYLMAYGIAGVSHTTDSLSAIKYAKVFPIYNEKNIIINYKINGKFPKYGNDDDNVDLIAKNIVELTFNNLSKYKLYKDARATLSLLTITSNVIYGKNTGDSPDGRKLGAPFAPGGSASYGAEETGAIASLNSIAKIPYNICQDGISNTFCISPRTLGKDIDSQINNGVALLDGYMKKKGFHLNLNIFDKELLLEAQKHPEKFPNITIRVSGYAVLWSKLTKEQQNDVLQRMIFNKF